MMLRLAGMVGLVGASMALISLPDHAAEAEPAVSVPTGALPGYADMVALLEPAPLVLTVQVRKVVAVEAGRARDVQPGSARVYVEAQPLIALRGGLPAVPLLTYLADVPLDTRGKLPPLARRTMLLVARPVADHPEMVQLVAPDAQLPWDPVTETRVRTVLDALRAPDAPARVTGVREASYVPGTLDDEGETQIFLTTANSSPAAVTVVHRPGQSTGWSVSFSEVVDATGQPPAHDTLAWYRLACSLPAALPAAANVSATPADQARAASDYRLVMTELGPCGQTR